MRGGSWGSDTELHPQSFKPTALLENAIFSIKCATRPQSTARLPFGGAASQNLRPPSSWAAPRTSSAASRRARSPPWWRRSCHRSCTWRRRRRWGTGCPSRRWFGGGWWSAGSCRSAASSSDLRGGRRRGERRVGRQMGRQTEEGREEGSGSGDRPSCPPSLPPSGARRRAGESHRAQASLRGRAGAGEGGRGGGGPGPGYLGRRPGCRSAGPPCHLPASRCTGLSLQNTVARVCLTFHKKRRYLPSPPPVALWLLNGIVCARWWRGLSAIQASAWRFSCKGFNYSFEIRSGRVRLSCFDPRSARPAVYVTRYIFAYCLPKYL